MKTHPSATLSALLALLREQLQVVTRLVAVVEDERRLVTAHDLAALGQIVNEKAELAARLEQLEQQRAALVGLWADVLAVPADELTLRRLIEALPSLAADAGPAGAELAALHDQLSDQLVALAGLNKRNRLLIVAMLGLVQQTREFVSQLESAGAGTALPSSHEARARLLDVRV